MWFNNVLSRSLTPLGLAIPFISSNFASATSIIDRTAFIFAFYTCDKLRWLATNGWNGHGDPLAAHKIVCTTAGPNWAMSLTDLVGHSTLIDLAVSGAVSDSDIVTTTPVDFRGQTTAFLNYVASSRNVSWTSRNAIFTITFGSEQNSFSKTPSRAHLFTANDVNHSYQTAEGNGTSVYSKDITSYFNTVDKLYNAGARQFVFNNVVPFDRAQIGISLGQKLAAKLKDNINEFNSQLAAKAACYCSSKPDITCLVFDTHTTFANVMDNYAAYGFATPSGYCEAYAKQATCDIVSQDQSCIGPISSYVWWNGLHPSYAADLVWAKELKAQLSYVS
ncbi:carbohydrate esterase family 16 protein [Laccaria amethystina LaAM-08-1]|uniref:Carbohydrate esterase family 16 protein n=1 Tax=Laccaria amethystina LaAM-08-1 TaxID=1095629 RepID=A0A0C9WLT9_9AGAR|nr:carbohydrate esterase family 16 protein [Laccaria amethystina LaAM-08-1]